MRYLGNALSLGMFDVEHVVLDVRQVGVETARAWAREGAFESCVGHADTAELVSALLGLDVPMRRVSTSLAPRDEILVAQYNGPRLPEGARALPEGAKIRWYVVGVGEGRHC